MRKPQHSGLALALAIALVIAGSALTWALLFRGTEQTGETRAAASPPAKAAEPAAWRAYRDPTLGMSVVYPDTWSVQPFEAFCRIVLTGVLFSNDDQTFRHSQPYQSCAWDMKALGSRFVVVQVSHFVGGPSFRPSDAPDTRFPLSVGDAIGESLHFQVARDNRYELRVWMGPEVSVADRRVAERIVSSISFSGS